MIELIFNTKVFGDRILRKRKEMGLSQMLLAEKVGVSAASIIAYEKGQKSPTINTAFAIATTLGVSLDWLCGKSVFTQPFKVENYGDLACVLLKLSNIALRDPEVIELPIPPENQIQIGNKDDGTAIWETTEKAVEIIIPLEGLALFIEKNNTMLNLMRNKTITDDIYYSWRAGEIENLRQYNLLNFAFEIPQSRQSDDQ